ncbi:MAG: hypothetical protein ACC618_02590 [Patescibacteria group bacterium]
MKLKNHKVITILLSLIILLTLFFPHYYAASVTPENMVFSGNASWFDPWDKNVYIAAINWAQNNGFIFQNAYTTKVHNPFPIYPFYTILGILFPNPEPILLYQLSTLVLAIVFLLTIYYLLKQLVPTYVNTAFYLIALGGGLGWLFAQGFSLPDATTTPFTFPNTLQRPHETLAMIFYLSSFYFFYEGVVKKKKTLIIRSALFANFFIFFYPFHLLSYYIILGSYTLIISLKHNEKTPLKNLLLAIAITLPVGTIYSLYLLKSGGVFSGVFSPNVPAPNLVAVAGGYGVLALFTIFALFQKKKDDLTLFLTLWFFLSILLSYLPLGFAKQYLRGLFFPAVLLSLLALKNLAKSTGLSKRLLLITIVVFVPITSYFISFKRILNVNANNRWYYLTLDEKRALDFLDQSTSPGSGVLAAYPFANYIPAHTGNRVYFGHFFQTPNSKEKIEKLTKFYANKLSGDVGKEFLIKNNISYVVWGVDEKEITTGSGETELKYEFLEVAYSNPKVTIFSF